MITDLSSALYTTRPRREAYSLVSGTYRPLTFLHTTHGPDEPAPFTKEEREAIKEKGEALPVCIARAVCIDPDAGTDNALEYEYKIFLTEDLTVSQRKRGGTQVNHNDGFTLEITTPTGSVDLYSFKFIESAYIVAETCSRFRDVLIMPRPLFTTGQEFDRMLTRAPLNVFSLSAFICKIAQTLLELQAFSFAPTEGNNVYSAAIEHRIAEVAALLELFLCFRRVFVGFPLNFATLTPVIPANIIPANSEPETQTTPTAYVEELRSPFHKRARVNSRRLSVMEGLLIAAYKTGSVNRLDELFRQFRERLCPADVVTIAHQVAYLRNLDTDGAVPDVVSFVRSSLECRPILRPKEKYKVINRLTDAYRSENKDLYPALCEMLSLSLSEEDWKTMVKHMNYLNSGEGKTK